MNLFEMLVDTMLSTSGEYGSFFWKAFFGYFFVEYCSTSSSVGVFGTICINVRVVWVIFLDVETFCLIDQH